MGRICTVCSHPQRDTIDAALVSGQSLGFVSQRFDLGKDAVRRHVNNHLSHALTAVRDARQDDRRASLLDRIESLIVRAESLFLSAAAEGKFSQSLDALVELRRQLELLGKATGELNDRPQVVVNLMASVEWLELRGAIFQSLSAYPEARAALSGRLLELEGKE